MLFKKKDDDLRLPDLPPARNSFGSSSSFADRTIDEPDEDEKHALPTFPDSPSHNRFSQAMIKDAVGEPREEVGEKKKPSFVELDEWRPSQKMEQEHYFDENSRPEYFESKMRRDFAKREMRQPESDVFIRIEKFRSARRSLDDVKVKLSEIDELIKRIRETKLREEQEFAFWEKELEAIKGRVQEVTENIFEKVE